MLEVASGHRYRTFTLWNGSEKEVLSAFKLLFDYSECSWKGNAFSIQHKLIVSEEHSKYLYLLEFLYKGKHYSDMSINIQKYLSDIHESNTFAISNVILFLNSTIRLSKEGDIEAMWSCPKWKGKECWDRVQSNILTNLSINYLPPPRAWLSSHLLYQTWMPLRATLWSTGGGFVNANPKNWAHEVNILHFILILNTNMYF